MSHYLFVYSAFLGLLLRHTASLKFLSGDCFLASSYHPRGWQAGSPVTGKVNKTKQTALVTRGNSIVCDFYALAARWTVLAKNRQLSDLYVLSTSLE